MKTLQDKRYKSFLTQLRLARLKKNLSQAEVAERLNKPQSFVSKIESGERRLDVIETSDLIKIYGVNWEDVI